MKIEIKTILNPEIYLQFTHWLKDIPYSGGMTYTDCLAKCLSGQYTGLLGLIDDEPVGIMVFYLYDNGTKCFIIGLWARNNLQKFVDAGIQRLKESGINTLRCYSSLDNFEKISGMKKLWSVYERAI